MFNCDHVDKNAEPAISPQLLKNFNPYDVLQPTLIQISDEAAGSQTLDLPSTSKGFDLVDLYENIYVTPQNITKSTDIDRDDFFSKIEFGVKANKKNVNTANVASNDASYHKDNNKSYTVEVKTNDRVYNYETLEIESLFDNLVKSKKNEIPVVRNDSKYGEIQEDLLLDKALEEKQYLANAIATEQFGKMTIMDPPKLKTLDKLNSNKPMLAQPQDVSSTDVKKHVSAVKKCKPPTLKILRNTPVSPVKLRNTQPPDMFSSDVYNHVRAVKKFEPPTIKILRDDLKNSSSNTSSIQPSNFNTPVSPVKLLNTQSSDVYAIDANNHASAVKKFEPPTLKILKADFGNSSRNTSSRQPSNVNTPVSPAELLNTQPSNVCAIDVNNHVSAVKKFEPPTLKILRDDLKNSSRNTSNIQPSNVYTPVNSVKLLNSKGKNNPNLKFSETSPNKTFAGYSTCSSVNSSQYTESFDIPLEQLKVLEANLDLIQRKLDTATSTDPINSKVSMIDSPINPAALLKLCPKKTKIKDPKLFAKKFTPLCDKDKLMLTEGPSIEEKNMYLPMLLARLDKAKKLLEADAGVKKRMVLDPGKKKQIELEARPDPVILTDNCNRDCCIQCQNEVRKIR